MPCPLCDHTLQNLGLDDPDRRTFWCPRCGTLQTETGNRVEYAVPRVAPNGLAATNLPDVCRSVLAAVVEHPDGSGHVRRERLAELRLAVLRSPRP